MANQRPAFPMFFQSEPMILTDIENGSILFDNGGKSRSLASFYPSLATPSSNGGRRLMLPLEHAAAFLEEHSSSTRKGVLVGYTSDPFSPFDTRFHTALSWLEKLATLNAPVIIQTQSPLIVLALPVLQALSKNLTVAFGLQAFRNSLSRRLFPQQSLPEERIKACRALFRFGINTNTQVTPLIEGKNYYNEIQEYAATLDEISCSITLHNTRMAGNAGTTKGLSAINKNIQISDLSFSRILSRGKSRVIANAHLDLFHRLLRLAPRKVLSHTLFGTPVTAAAA